MKDIDWVATRGIANEPTFDEFIQSVGGTRVDALVSNPTFENADYYFSKQNVIVELKIFETEFGSTPEFKSKRDRVIQRHVAEHGLRGLFLGQSYAQQFLVDIAELYRAPLARIAKKANRQIRETQKHLGLSQANGVLICVNDNFGGIEPLSVFGLLCRILNGSCSSISAVVYLTNHYVHVPGNSYANLLWIPAYSNVASDSISEFVNFLGKEWGAFCESRFGQLNRTEASDALDLLGTRVIKA